jgi:hypothetical protein
MALLTARQFELLANSALCGQRVQDNLYDFGVLRELGLLARDDAGRFTLSRAGRLLAILEGMPVAASDP